MAIDWKDVNVQMPEYSGLVIVYANDIVHSGIEVINCYVCPEYGFQIFCTLDEEDYELIVTHWDYVDAPLPAMELTPF